MKIHPAGNKIIIILTLAVIALLVFLTLVLFKHKILLLLLYVLGLVFIILVIRFFRRPSRNNEEVPDNVCSAADGNVVAVEEVYEKEYFNEKRIQVSVFMSVFNVHVNWIPVSGEIVYLHHEPGKNYPAYAPKSSELNERNTVVISTEKGKEIMTRQIAGIMARRIICEINKGDQVLQGQEIGIIKFGSRVDLFLPLNAEVLVKIGDKVRGNKTPIARLI